MTQAQFSQLRPEGDLFFREADLRISIVRHCFKIACSGIPADSALNKTLDLAQAGLNRARSNDPNQKLHPDMGRAISAIWRLANSLRILAERGISFDHHLQVMIRGSQAFGVKDAPGAEVYKDFEFELCVAAELADQSSHPIQLHPPGSRFDITFANDLLIECKHPSSEKTIASSITSFGKELESVSGFGVMVLGLEDVLELASAPLVKSLGETMDYSQTKLNDVLNNRVKGWLNNFQHCERMLGIFLMATVPVFFDEGDRASHIMCPLKAIGPSRSSNDVGIDKHFRDLLTALQ